MCDFDGGVSEPLYILTDGHKEALLLLLGVRVVIAQVRDTLLALKRTQCGMRQLLTLPAMRHHSNASNPLTASTPIPMAGYDIKKLSHVPYGLMEVEFRPAKQ